MQSTTADEVFLSSLRVKGPTAFDQFYSRYAPALYGDLLRSLPSKKAADETLACAILHCWKSIDSYDPRKERFFTWLLRTVRKEATKCKVQMAMEALLACRHKAA